jgi:hypothetical protein
MRVRNGGICLATPLYRTLGDLNNLLTGLKPVFGISAQAVDQRGDIVDADEPLTKSPHLQLDHVHLLEPELMNRIWGHIDRRIPKMSRAWRTGRRMGGS